jgi:hypothetical protein
MTDIIEFLTTVHWPGALIVAAAIAAAGRIIEMVLRG